MAISYKIYNNIFIYNNILNEYHTFDLQCTFVCDPLYIIMLSILNKVHVQMISELVTFYSAFQVNLSIHCIMDMINRFEFGVKIIHSNPKTEIRVLNGHSNKLFFLAYLLP